MARDVMASPGRWSLPESDDNILAALLPGFRVYNKWPDIEGGQYHIMMRKKLLLTCGNCQLICHPEKEERLRRHKMLIESGVVVQRVDGRPASCRTRDRRSAIGVNEPGHESTLPRAMRHDPSSAGN